MTPTLSQILGLNRGVINPECNFEGIDDWYVRYAGQKGAGWLRKEPWKVLNAALIYVATCWTGPGNRNLQTIVGDCGLKLATGDFGVVPGHDNGGHKGGAMADIDYFTLLAANETHHPPTYNLFTVDGKVDVSVLDVPRTWAFLRVLSMAFPFGYAMVDERLKARLGKWGRERRGLDIEWWLRGDRNPVWNHDKHMHLCLDGNVAMDAAFIMLDPANVKPVTTVDPYPNPSKLRVSSVEFAKALKAVNITVPPYLADETGILPKLDELKHELIGFDPGGPYVKNDNDCDDFAFRCAGYLNTGHPEWLVGIAWSSPHAFCIAMCDDMKIYIVEPQTKTVMLYTEKLGANYIPPRLIIVKNDTDDWSMVA